MDEAEFLRLLERFPVVRKKTHARVEWNAIDGEQQHQHQQRVGSEMEPPGSASTATIVDEGDSLAIGAAKFLATYFGAVETQHIQREFEKAHADFLAGLSLEDIDDLCAQFTT